MPQEWRCPAPMARQRQRADILLRPHLFLSRDGLQHRDQLVEMVDHRIRAEFMRRQIIETKAHGNDRQARRARRADIEGGIADEGRTPAAQPRTFPI